MIPSGNVTFLFTDIEGSTKLSQKFPDSLSAALNKHNEILNKVIESYNGFVFKKIGDAYCCAFEKAEDAVKAAVEAQIDLANEKWDESVIKVRMGIHSGNAEWNGNDYMCFITLARAARVMSAAYGEQILISNDAYENYFHHKSAAGGTKPQRKNDTDTDNNVMSLCDLVVDNLSFRDLGERRLKDVIQPIRLFQIVAKGLREDFPPLKTLDARPNNLPIQLTNFIGREDDMKITKQLLKDSRLLTITGTGGAGKTRLSLQTGADMIDDFANGVWFLELAAISDPDSVPIAFINIFGLKEEPRKTPEETLKGYLKDKEILIILDNCEHLIEVCAEITEKLLLYCPGLKIIATSRELLNIAGEQIYKIPPLTLPDLNKNDSPDQLSQYESVRLFIERALGVNPKFRINKKNAPAIAGICSYLDGIPLAIELAAAKIKVLSPEKIYERLDDSFNLLSGGKRTALPRQQTLKALIEWSYDLLTHTEKTLWSRLSVFSCGWTLEAAEEICSDETINKYEILKHLTGLSEKSIIIYDESKERYKLIETIKKYGREKLENENEIFSKHLDYFSTLVQKAIPELKGDNVKLWLDIFEADHNNFLSAIEWGVKNKEVEKGAIVAIALGIFWEIRGQYTTGIRIIEIILHKQAELSKDTKANLLNLSGNLHRYQGNFDSARKIFEESMTIKREIGDKQGISTAIINLGTLAFSQGDFEKAKKFFEESIAIKRELGDKIGIAGSMNNLGGLAFSQGEYKHAKKFYMESLAIRKEIGDKQGIAASLNNLGGLELYQGNYKKAKKFFEESLVIKREFKDKKGIATLLGNLGTVAKTQGDYVQTRKIYEESLSVFREIGDKKGIADFLNNLGDLAGIQRDYVKAKKFYEESLPVFREIGDKQGIASSLSNLGNMVNLVGDYEQAKKFIKESLAIFMEIGDKYGVASSISNLGRAALSQREYELAKKYLKECLDIQLEIGDKKGIADTLNYMGNVAFGLEDFKNAIILMNAAEKEFESLGAVLGVEDQKIKDQNIAKIREELTEEKFEKYRKEGMKMTVEEAVQLAVSI